MTCSTALPPHSVHSTLHGGKSLLPPPYSLDSSLDSGALPSSPFPETTYLLEKASRPLRLAPQEQPHFPLTTMMATAQPTSVPSAAQGPQQQYTPPNSQGYPQAQQFAQRASPSASANATPATQSPQSVQNPSTFPQLPLAQRQIRPPKSPLYIPAALRPTDRPQRAAPLTPPRSLHGSTDSLDQNVDPNRPMSRRSTDPGKSRQVLDKVPETSSDDVTTATQGEAVEDTSDLPALTGDPPTRHHWKADAHAFVCDGPTCQKNFGLFERRHHCRHCGNIFCREHSSLQIPLDQNADFHPHGMMVRSCGHCQARYDEWIETRRQMKKGDTTGNLEQNSPIRLIGGKNVKTPDAHKGSVAGSVSRDWNWSTF